jgi:hypothetical protein
MLLGYILGKMAATAPEKGQEEDAVHGVFASVAHREAAALGLEAEISGTNKSTLAGIAETIKAELTQRHSAECASVFQLGLGLSLTTMQREPINKGTESQLLLMAVLCNLSDEVSTILEGPITDRDKRIVELIKYIDAHPRVVTQGAPPPRTTTSAGSTGSSLSDSLTFFRQDHPVANDTCFIMMRFDETEARGRITSAVKRSLADWGLVGLRADDRQYHDELFSNVVTYLHGCGTGIAVYEVSEAMTFNPNISLEVGYMLALGKPVLLLKDKNLSVLHADLIGRLYKEFDPANPNDTIPIAVERWLRDKGIIK